MKRGKDRLDITAEHGIIMIMGGQCQNTHKHQVPKISDKKAKEYGRRINITFRMF
jgi:alkylated DNA repair dioxygenase AlkB